MLASLPAFPGPEPRWVAKFVNLGAGSDGKQDHAPASHAIDRVGERGPQLLALRRPATTTCDDDLRRERPDQRNTGVVEHAVSMGATERPSLTNSSTAPRPIPLAPPLMIAILPPHLPMRFAVFGSTPRCYRSLSDTPFRSQRCGARRKVRPTMQAAAPPRHKRTRR
jgi:hypothetical protein